MLLKEWEGLEEESCELVLTCCEYYDERMSVTEKYPKCGAEPNLPGQSFMFLIIRTPHFEKPNYAPVSFRWEYNI